MAFPGRWVEIEEERFQELLLNNNLMGVDAERVSGDVEDLAPEHSFQFEVLISSSEQRVSLHLVTSINLVIH